MKTKKEIEKENGILTETSIYTLEEFEEQIDKGGIDRNDGEGYFHNGENETRISVWDDSLTWEDVKDYPYVCWYNK